MSRKQSVTDSDVGDMLTQKGYRRTAGRMALLEILSKTRRPLSIAEIIRLWKKDPLDQATLYRALEDFARTGVVHRSDLNTGTARYEYLHGRPHHHHLVCAKCELVEDVEVCVITEAQKKVLQRSSSFTAVYSHNLEFFGLCTACSKV